MQFKEKVQKGFAKFQALDFALNLFSQFSVFTDVTLLIHTENPRPSKLC